ncbi:hypothetical protein ACS126_18560 [Sphingobacterium lactis]|uniref:hypothetical protein n=1 Tax=Sphingobacterium lactis TaxID=797291 RepID=UPI003EC6E3E5
MVKNSQKFSNKEIIEQINYFITNEFLNSNITKKLNVCHFLFSSFTVYKQESFFRIGLDLLEETIKFSYLNKKTDKLNFYLTISYSLYISLILNIQIDVKDLITKSKSKIFENQIFNLYQDNNLFKTDTKIEDIIRNNNIYLIFILQIRNKIIRKSNYLNIINRLESKFMETYRVEIIFINLLASFLFNNESKFNESLNLLESSELTNSQRKIISLIAAKNNTYTDSLNTFDLLFISPKGTIGIELAIIFYFMLNM